MRLRTTPYMPGHLRCSRGEEDILAVNMMRVKMFEESGREVKAGR